MPKASPVSIGIDLGTTYSVLAHLDARRRPATVLNSEGDITTPSAVFFDRSTVVVGKEAVKAGAHEPERLAQFAKRDMGRSTFSKVIGSERLPPEVIQAFVLKKLKEDAELKLGEIRDAVVTVPAYYNEPRRKATQDAGRLAGLNVLDIINEPTAAAIAYGVEQGFLNEQGEAGEEETILVYDLGGGTFDATLMRIEGHNYRAIATSGDVYLGGIDWDRRVVDFVAEQFVEEHGEDPRQDPEALQELLAEAEDAKRALTARDEVALHFAHEGCKVRTRLSREDFEQLTGDLMERTLFTIRKMLTQAKLSWDDLTRVLLVGGSTRMPMVSRRLGEESGLKPDRSLSPDEAVAHGAAIYAGLLLDVSRGERPNMSVENVNSHDLGVLGIEQETGRPRRQILVARNSRLPATGHGRFVTHAPNQSSVAVNVIEGGDASGNNATPIGKCVIVDLPPGLPAGEPIEVTFRYGRNGRLMVRARLPKANREASLLIQRASGLSERMLCEWEQRIEEGIKIADATPAAEEEDVAVLEDAEDLEEVEDLGDVEEVDEAAQERDSDRAAKPRAKAARRERRPAAPIPLDEPDEDEPGPLDFLPPPSPDDPAAVDPEDDDLNRFFKTL